MWGFPALQKLLQDLLRALARDLAQRSDRGGLHLLFLVLEQEREWLDRRLEEKVAR